MSRVILHVHNHVCTCLSTRDDVHMTHSRIEFSYSVVLSDLLRLARFVQCGLCSNVCMFAHARTYIDIRHVCTDMTCSNIHR